MAIFEIINPSDPYTMETEDWEAACIATVLLGSGQYALHEVGGERSMPIFIFGGADEWFKEQFGCTFEESLHRVDNPRVGAVLDTVLTCKATERQDFKDAIALIDDPAKREQYREKWHDRRRSSMNDIGERAWSYAKRLQTAV